MKKNLIFLTLLVTTVNGINQPSFGIDKKSKSFVKDGQAFRYISGSLHYFRIPREYWQDRLQKVRALGLNAIQMYVEWSFHESRHGVYNFEGQRDIVAFIKMAQANELLVLLRPGPFIDAERDMGGLPFWLLSKHPDIKLRSSDKRFLRYVDEWFAILLPQLRPLLYINGGNIIMVQLENEYGSYALQTKHTDIQYLISLKDTLKKHLGPDVFIYTTDGCSTNDVLNGRVAETFSTVDFGSKINSSQCFEIQSYFEPDGPKVNSEFYPGWLDHWGEPHASVDASVVQASLDTMLKSGANVNIYMVHGGTSFGFEAGANDPPFQPNPTSYDYDAPISEAGDLTPKFFALKSVIDKHFNQVPHPLNVTISSPKGNYGEIKLKAAKNILHDKTHEIKSAAPLTFEAIHQAYGLVKYQKEIEEQVTNPALLKISEVHDRGYVYIDGHFQGILSRMANIDSMPISVQKGQSLQIIVENQGRICYGPGINDFKGITSNVTLNGKSLEGWAMTGYPMTNLDHEESDDLDHEILKNAKGAMTFWTGKFRIPCHETIAKDTFLNLKGWSKGIAFLNGINLGRYWPIMGPQQTLYVPGCWIKPRCQTNNLVLFEQEAAPLHAPKVKLVKHHIIDGPIPKK